MAGVNQQQPNGSIVQTSPSSAFPTPFTILQNFPLEFSILLG
jgi:hypothetical protein